RQSLREPRGARRVEGLLADLRHAAPDDLSDLARIDLRSLDAGLLHGAQQIGGMESREPAFAASDGRANGFDDENFLHDVPPPRVGLLPRALRRVARDTEPQSKEDDVRDVRGG